MDRREFQQLWTSDDAEDRRRARELAASDPSVARLAAWEARLDEAARSLRPSAPESSLQDTLHRWRSEHEDRAAAATPGPRPLAGRILRRWWPLPAGLAAAALVLVMLRPPPEAPVATEAAARGLLSDADLDQALRRQRDLEQRHLVLRRSLPERSDSLTPLSEEIRQLDGAIDELRLALDGNRKHQHLRERLVHLSDRRNALLAQWTSEQGG